LLVLFLDVFLHSLPMTTSVEDTSIIKCRKQKRIELRAVLTLYLYQTRLHNCKFGAFHQLKLQQWMPQLILFSSLRFYTYCKIIIQLSVVFLV